MTRWCSNSSHSHCSPSSLRSTSPPTQYYLCFYARDRPGSRVSATHDSAIKVAACMGQRAALVPRTQPPTFLKSHSKIYAERPPTTDSTRQHNCTTIRPPLCNHRSNESQTPLQLPQHERIWFLISWASNAVCSTTQSTEKISNTSLSAEHMRAV